MDQSLIFNYLKRTRIIEAPKSTLATFGATHIEYHLISPIDNLKDKTRLRQGEVISHKPQIITPQTLSERFLSPVQGRWKRQRNFLFSH